MSLGNFRLTPSIPFIFFIVLYPLSQVDYAADVPQPPCGLPPLPSYADITAPPNIGVWKQQDIVSWSAPECTGWSSMRFGLVLAVAGRLRVEANTETLLMHFGEVSRLVGVRYWSVSRKRWQNLVTEANALEGPDGKRRRGDFSVNEMKSGQDLYFSLRNGGSGSVIYRMRVRELEANRLILETQNVTSVRRLAFPLFNPGDLRSVYFFDASSPNAWNYYSLTGIRQGAGRMVQDSEASYINRAVAIFRKIAGIPTDQEPPAAP